MLNSMRDTLGTNFNYPAGNECTVSRQSNTSADLVPVTRVLKIQDMLKRYVLCLNVTACFSAQELLCTRMAVDLPDCPNLPIV